MSSFIVKKSPFDIISERVLQSIEQIIEEGGKPEWFKPWTFGIGEGLPYNLNSKRPYSGTNLLLLLLEATTKQYSSNAWLTGKQIKELNGTLKDGERGCPIVYFKATKVIEKNPKTNKKEEKTKRILRYYTVYNYDQTDGIDISLPVVEKQHHPERVDDWESLVKKTGANIEHRVQDRALYNSVADQILMPELDQFTATEEYYATLFHELAHWTGHKSRLNRGLNFKPTKAQYAYEELIAELASIFMSLKLGYSTENLFQNSTVYLKGYYEFLKENKGAFLSASWAAGKAVNYILNGN